MCLFVFLVSSWAIYKFKNELLKKILKYETLRLVLTQRNTVLAHIIELHGWESQKLMLGFS